MAITITGNIPSGRIAVDDVSDPGDLRLRLVPDEISGFLGYYHFRASGVRAVPCRFRIVNAGDCFDRRLAGREEVEDAWTNTGPMASYDRKRWFRLKGQVDGDSYVFDHTPDFDTCYYATWAPYPLDRELDAMARWQTSPRVRISTIGATVDGAPLDMLTVGEAGPDKKICWIIARQHPSETMGGYFIEGFMDRMIDPHDPVARALLGQAVLHVVPNMNPDGSRRGFTRGNAAGANLNREWISPSPTLSPEVFHVRALMEQTGVDFAIDCHGDEELRCNFLGGPLEIPSRSDRLKTLFHAFEDCWAAASPDYERGHPYPGGPPAEADLSMAWNWIAERFDCLSVLLEQPFKDTSWWQDPVTGWSPDRAVRFGTSLPPAILGVLDRLR
jgi:murein tripeptide amidase MpaA